MIKIGDFGLSRQLLGVQGNVHVDRETKKTRPGTEGAATNHQADFWPSKSAIVQKRYNSQALVHYGKPTVDPLTAGVGTASYASPEQVKSRRYSYPADIFSLGLIFLELISCFETEHERLHNFQRCRDQQLPAWIHDHYPDLAEIVLSCTKANPSLRPSAQNLVEKLSTARAPRLEADINILRRQLADRGKELEQSKNELAEKDKIIKELRLEVEAMKRMVPTSPCATAALAKDTAKYEVTETVYVVEEVNSFQEEK